MTMGHTTRRARSLRQIAAPFPPATSRSREPFSTPKAHQFRPRLASGLEPILIDTALQAEFRVTYSKQRIGKSLTEIRTHIGIFEILQISAQNLGPQLLPKLPRIPHSQNKGRNPNRARTHWIRIRSKSARGKSSNLAQQNYRRNSHGYGSSA